jgi:hypothetical protein
VRAALSCRNVIGVIAALAVLGHAAAALGQSGDVEIFAYDEYIGLFSNDPPTIPPSLRRDAQMAFDAHKAVLGEPPIQTIYKNKPVIFLTNDKGSAAATAGNFVPYEIDTRQKESMQKESVCFGPQKRIGVHQIIIPYGLENILSNRTPGRFPYFYRTSLYIYGNING